MSRSLQSLSRPVLRQNTVLTQKCHPVTRHFQTTSITTITQQSHHSTQPHPPPPYALAWQVPSNEGKGSNAGFFTPSPAPQRSNSSSPRNNGEKDREVSEHEFQLRVGRAYDLLRATIPDFMRIGLVDYDQYSSHDKQSSSKMSLLDALMFRSLRERAAEDGLLGGLTGVTSGGDKNSLSGDLAASGDQQVYHSNIHFRFCPVGSSADANLTDEEAASLSFTGRSLYFASAQVLRHTLNVLFTNTQVSIESIRREKKGANSRKEQQSASEGLSSNLSREETIYLRVQFLGHLRVTGAEHRYTLIFRYEFDPKTGRILNHTVERIEPAIGRKLWFGLASVWQRITGTQQQQHHPVPTAIHAHCSSHDGMTRSRIDRIRNGKTA
ncbi:uncharacterized protein FA14DRAFT_182592 [Meira miltonrushii]|uniref:Uncharacterized protein n=1 Tax=Meira miltonrushii TaxID=1280837 RepID=A0A316V6F6_9BASI|nr:uncharacterized protein FA14DRAFT_182592 [Meira miltonrushii]PWN31803.1 hypothetical protein FA14DRAFT_182592 [Meira miltonrushii]